MVISPLLNIVIGVIGDIGVAKTKQENLSQ